MPTALIWKPTREHKFGHVAIQTNRYHISFWPYGHNEKQLGLILNRFKYEGAACIVFHDFLDMCLQAGKKVKRPKPKIALLACSTDEAINSLYEEFLEYNGVNAADVTRTKGKEIIVKEKGKKRQSDQYKNDHLDTKELWPLLTRKPSQTTYKLPHETMVVNPNVSFMHRLLSTKFYQMGQCCTSFCFHLIELTKNKVMSTFEDSFSDGQIDVLTFQKIAEENYKTNAKDDTALDTPGYSKEFVLELFEYVFPFFNF